MYDLHELQLQTQAYETRITELESALHIGPTRDRISELTQLSQEPEFWENPERAQKIQQELTHAQKKLDRFARLKTRYEDILLMIELAEEEGASELGAEISGEFDKLAEDYETIRLETLFTGRYDDRNAILTLHAGAGGTEAQDWCEMLYRMYLRFCEAHGFTTRELDYLEGDDAGIKSVSMMIEGENAYGFLRSEAGVHRLVRISPFDSSGRRHTSFASCEVMPELDTSIEITIKPDDLRIDTYRSTGKGGQHVNKTDSAVRITHLPTGVVAACQAERSQIQNRETAMKMLKAKLFAIAEAAQKASIDELKGNQMEIAWGSQIRSYVFCPYTMVKDHRSDYEEVSVQDVMDGHLDGFINAYLSMMARESQGA
ncbi:MAG: peptide chain release factor 2 [Eubacteriales bacterium]|nr:peptide chain release factor 2 [Eubacteriales bacterium]